MGFNVPLVTSMEPQEVERYGKILEYKGFFSWHVLSSLGTSLIMILPWLILLVLFVLCFTKKGRRSYKASQGSYVEYGKVVVTLGICTWFAGCFAFGGIFSGFFGYHLHCWFSIDTIHTAEQFFFRYLTIMGWLTS